MENIINKTIDNVCEPNNMNIVIIGHVDHGKSTVIGRLLADTNSLPEGKLSAVKLSCEKNSRPFEYAFLLDALKDEQAQGITIDSARCFFKTDKRNYIVIDAPGHIEFLKNMITGAARAEAALLVIDAHEGIKENSRRHGYLLSMLGVNQVTVLVNKMDLINYDEKIFRSITKEFSAFLKGFGVTPESFIPVCARDGENMTFSSSKMDWYKGLTVLEQMDAFKNEESEENRPLRLPLQDIYKFTENNDDRRIFTGKIETGKLKCGDDVIFYPSGKKTKVKTIEVFNSPKIEEIEAGHVPGFTVDTQIYVKPGEIIAKANEAPPYVSTRFKANIFWLGHSPMIMNKNYKLKLASMRSPVKLVEIRNIIDSSELTTITNKTQVDLFDTAECIFETPKPIAFDLSSEFKSTGRFVIVDNYEISGGGIITGKVETEESTINKHVEYRNITWENGIVTNADRALKWKQKSKFILFTGASLEKSKISAKQLEKKLFDKGLYVYYLGCSNLSSGLDDDLVEVEDHVFEEVRRLGEIAKLFTEAGLIFITTLNSLDNFDLDKLRLLNSPNEIFIINIENGISDGIKADLTFSEEDNPELITEGIIKNLIEKEILPEYCI